MAYGQLDRKQAKALRALVKGKRIHDLGCGDQVLTRDLVKFGATEVIAIDTHPYGEPRPRITTIKSSFEDYALEMYMNQLPDIEVAFVSWPANRRMNDLLLLIETAKFIVYLGKCTDGTSCGWPGLFEHFLSRTILSYIPHRHNTLCIYGDRLTAPREGELEERAGLDWQKVWPYYGVSIGESHERA